MLPTKQQIRTTIAAKRDALDFQWLEAASAEISARFQTLDAFQSSETIALYKAIGGEVSLEPLFSKAWKLGKRTCIPVFNAKTRLYEMAEITTETEFRTGPYGIQEPVSPALLALSEIDLIAVPGVAFDAAGNRLGRGGGYYDRMLESFDGFSVGVSFDFQLLPEIPIEAHDQPLDAVVTETKMINA
ncbi:5-formyltetrahydrofolate cyclo-ligase [Pontiellaceae bacterium B12219]|nr:5-formyltetrahydrofolate cyclo-ligase [Pontiellaceae bacterium B12219]